MCSGLLDNYMQQWWVWNWSRGLKGSCIILLPFTNPLMDSWDSKVFIRCTLHNFARSHPCTFHLYFMNTVCDFELYDLAILFYFLYTHFDLSILRSLHNQLELSCFVLIAYLNESLYFKLSKFHTLIFS